MSKETYVGGDIIETIGGKDLSFASDIILNIGSQVIQNGLKDGVSYGEPQQAPKIELKQDTKCFCSKDFSVEDMINIIYNLRDKQKMISKREVFFNMGEEYIFSLRISILLTVTFVTASTISSFSPFTSFPSLPIAKGILSATA